ncbi:Mitochondrial carrier [Gracilaria domingensis]|nr:Mitochondrial carrier [Gracilaria domingensis]
MTNSSKRLSPARDLLCGAVAGITARLVVAPLDMIKIRFQVQSETRGLYQYRYITSALRTIVANEGLRALWKGNLSAMLMVTPYSALQLAAFYQLQQTIQITEEPYASFSSLSVGAISSCFATVCTYPLDLLRTRFAAQSEPRQYPNLRHAMAIIYSREGVRGFYAGLQPTLLSVVPYMSIQFAVYERAKQKILSKSSRQDLHPTESVATGAVSGVVSKLLTLPLDNAKKIMQVGGQFQANKVTADHGMSDVLARVWSMYGWRGWFRGAMPSILKAAPNSAITFSVYEAVKRHFL